MKVRCRHCQSKLQNKNATKCHDHTIKCQARIDAGIEYSVMPTTYPRASSSSNGQQDEVAIAARAILVNDMGGVHFSSPSASRANGDMKQEASGSGVNKRKVAEMLSELLFDDSMQSRKKPVHLMTDDEMRKEERELRLKELRLNVRQMQLKNQLLERLLPLSERAGEAIERYLSSTDGASEHAGDDQQSGIHESVFDEENNQRVAIVYANPDDQSSSSQQ